MLLTAPSLALSASPGSSSEPLAPDVCTCSHLVRECAARALWSTACWTTCCQPPPPLSVVIPSFARVHNVQRLLVTLLSYPALHRSGSEVLVAHGSRASFDARKQLDAASRQACGQASGCHRRVRHLDLVQLNNEMFVAERFYAATLANNEVVVHLDDDLVPSAELLDELALAVVAEPGFPRPTHPGVYGPAVRQCDRVGYADPLNNGTHPSTGRDEVVLTNLAGTSKLLNERFVHSFNTSWKPLLHLTRGDGEDLAINFFARRAGGTPVAVHHGLPLGSPGSPVRLLDEGLSSGSAFQSRRGHFARRNRICRCLGTGHDGEALAACLQQKERDQEYVCEVGEECRRTSP